MMENLNSDLKSLIEGPKEKGTPWETLDYSYKFHRLPRSRSPENSTVIAINEWGVGSITRRTSRARPISAKIKEMRVACSKIAS